MMIFSLSSGLYFLSMTENGRIETLLRVGQCAQLCVIRFVWRSTFCGLFLINDSTLVTIMHVCRLNHMHS